MLSIVIQFWHRYIRREPSEAESFDAGYHAMTDRVRGIREFDHRKHRRHFREGTEILCGDNAHFFIGPDGAA